MNEIRLRDYGFSIIEIETLSLCNMSCSFCAYPGRADKGMILAEQQVFNVIDSIERDEDFKYICFNQLNEPLMDSRVYSFIQYAKNKGLSTLLITNGLLFQSADTVSRLVDAGPDHVKISLQILNAESYIRCRSSELSFEKYKEGIFRYLKAAADGESDVVIDLACNYKTGASLLCAKLFGLERGDPSAYNGIGDMRHDLKEFLRELRGIDARFISDDFSVDSYLDELKRDYRSQREFRVAANVSIKVKPFFYGRRLAEFYPVKNAARCRNKILGILASGSVVPCCLAYGDLLSMGNINVDTLSDILRRSSGFLKLIRQGGPASVICRRCMGAPTRRGALLKNIRNSVGSGWRSVFPHLSLSGRVETRNA